MILQALYALAEREKLMVDPNYEIKPVAWLVRVGPGGQLIQIESTRSPEVLPESTKRKPKMLAKSISVPRESERTSGDHAFFLVDKAEYVFGIDPTGSRPAKKLATRRDLFRERVEACLEATKDPGIQSVHAFLESIQDGSAVVSVAPDCQSNDLFAFVYGEDDDLPVHLRPGVREYWKNQRETSFSTKGSARCLVTGEVCDPVDKLPSLKKLPGSTSGVALISFNSSAFESYGLKGAGNAPISAPAADAVMTALNRLVHPAFPDPTDPNRTLPRRNTKLSADTVACYWTHEPQDDVAGEIGPILDADSDAYQARSEEVKALYDSVWRGDGFRVPDPSAFYSIVLSGGQGRATLRQWIETNTQAVVDNLAAYFKDLSIVRRNTLPKGQTLRPGFPIEELLEAVAEPCERRSEGVPAHVASQLYLAAIDGQPFPMFAYQRAINRYRVEIGDESDEGRNGWNARRWNDARAALIKAGLNRRKQRSPETETYQEVTVDMNPNNKEPGYLLGQLMAVLERLQREALGEVNASIVDRCFSGASAAPKSIFVSLLKNARHHASKCKDDPSKRGYIWLLEGLIDHLSDGFMVPDCLTYPAKSAFPAGLDLDEQGMFVLGYHHMRKWLWMTTEERETWEADHRDAPRAYRWLSNKEDKPSINKE